MAHDQCPSTVQGESKYASVRAAVEAARVASLAGRAESGGSRVWRSIEDLAEMPGFREHLEKEFPHGALEMQRAVEAGGESRRDFLKIMGGSLALAGVAAIPGCRQPDHKIMPYSREVPEEIIPGKPLFYATSMARPDGGAEGLLVETHEGRPTKIEGNPLHSINNGKCSTWALASIMGLYDPDRLKFPMFRDGAKGAVEATWDDFRAWAGTHFAGYDASGGEGLGFIVGKASSPSLEAAKAAILKKWPKAAWAWHAPLEASAAIAGSVMAFGKPMREVLNLGKATSAVIVSLDRDFLYHEADELVNSRGFAKSREVMDTKDTMSRLYVVESMFSVTGAAADHRVKLAPSRIGAFAVELAKFVLPRLEDAGAKTLASAIGQVNVAAGGDIDKRFVEEVGKDLLDAAHRGKTLVLAGHGQPAEVHALCYAMNAALGSVGTAVTYQPMTEDEAADGHAQLTALAEKAKSGGIKTLVVVNANPAFDAPGDIDFGAAWTKVPATVTLSVGQSETAAASTWSLNGAHYLEAWGDTRATNGTIAPVQPMIAPLYDPPGAKAVLSEIEFLSLLAGKDMNARVDGYEIVRANWKKSMGDGFETTWRRSLHDGVVANTQQKGATPAVKADAVAAGIAKILVAGGPSTTSLDVTFLVGHLQDGRYANLAWLYELPEVGTRTVWDNPVLMSPKTAEDLGVLPEGYSAANPSGMYTEPHYPTARLAEVSIGGKTATMPCWILPGMADNTLGITCGFGRTACGKVGDGVGVNVFPLRSAAVMKNGGRLATGAKLTKSAGTYLIASTQNHWSMEGRTAIVRAVDLPAWQQHGEAVQEVVDRFYGTQSRLNFAEQLGDMAHNPPMLGLYRNPYNESNADAAPGSKFAKGNQWAMTIDQTLCTGCGTCTIACQAENNIPVVGKKETAKGREMTWIRVDRYFTGSFDAPETMYHQPVACVHCENAPCETVCPVNATVHGPEGINYMTYNRCIGTRYCANNCPYKVRRYNFFEYGKLAFNGDYIGKELLDKLGDIIPGQGVGPNGSSAHNKLNVNFIPPRLRDKISEIERMQKNPDVTVRMRGVMEKCSYCIQRINQARIETKVNKLPGIPDGFFETACQQACPSDAIVFGDILDAKSRITKTKGNARSYGLLGYLNTRPRTSHMVRVMNPNPALCSEERKHAWKEPFHHGGGHEGGGSHAPSEADHKPEAPATHSFRIDPRRGSEDRGYALSLNVLSGGSVPGARA